VRAFAHALGDLTAAGACLAALRRTRSGGFRIGDAVPLDHVVQDPSGAAQRIIPPERLLEWFPAVLLSPEDCRRVSHGQEVERPATRTGAPAAGLAAPDVSAVAVAKPDVSTLGLATGDWVRLVDTDGRLVALARPGSRPDSLHPAVVLI
jgi:tRNA pseudouridine55 synthase